MKTRIFLQTVLAGLILAACSSAVEKTNETALIPPKVKEQPRLLYPKLAQENGYTGSTRVIISVSKTGEIENAVVSSSSGYEILDEAALDYCNKVVFYPATRDGREVSSRIAWDINFNIADINQDANAYLININRLYKNISSGMPLNDRKTIQSKILAAHNDFVNEMKDALSFNIVLEKTLQPDIVKEWKNYWDSWPLSFLLYHDFLKRFPDYDSTEAVKTQLQKAVLFDLEYIQNSPVYSISSQREKEKIVNLIRNFMMKNYPGLLTADVEDFYKS